MSKNTFLTEHPIINNNIKILLKKIKIKQKILISVEYYYKIHMKK